MSHLENHIFLKRREGVGAQGRGLIDTNLNYEILKLIETGSRQPYSHILMSLEPRGLGRIWEISISQKSQLEISSLVSITILRLRLNYGFRPEPWGSRFGKELSEEKK